MRRRAVVTVVVFLASCASSGPQRFESADAAVKKFIDAVRADDMATMESCLGSEGQDILHSGDDVADRAGRQKLLALYDERHALVPDSDGTQTLVVGSIEWPFPIPLVPDGGSWSFDADAGREEIIARRVGRNELDAIEVARACGDAEYDYAEIDRDGDGVLEFATKIRSTEGKRDGLFWKCGPNEPPSPLGELCAEAAAEGYGGAKPNERIPYHGYYYRLLTAQGQNAPGGARDYLVGDNLVGGAALVAYPAEYGVSGVMTFIASLDGGVHEQDLGEETESLALEMKSFDPDGGWKPVSEDR